MLVYAITWLALRRDRRGVTAMEYRFDRCIDGGRHRCRSRYARRRNQDSLHQYRGSLDEWYLRRSGRPGLECHVVWRALCMLD